VTPRPSRVRWPLRGLLLSLFLSVPTARAGTPEDKIPLRYTAPTTCDEAATFRARLDALPASPGAASKRGDTLVITITRAGGIYTGGLHLTRADGTAADRTVVSERCEDVSEALVFVAALALGLAPPQPAHQAPPPASPRDSLPPDALHVAPDRPARPPSRWRFLGALRGAVLSGVGPAIELAPEVAVGVMRDARGLLAPTFELSGTWATSGSIVTSDGTAVVTLWGGTAATCPIRLELGAGFAVRPCAELNGGLLAGSASGAGVSPGPGKAVPWVAAGATLRIEWRFGAFFAIEAEGGANYEFLRSRLYFTPSGTDVYRVPDVGTASKLGIIFLWP
jgi:hypothetical protein